jgi:excisionase family DNA binding protein
MLENIPFPTDPIDITQAAQMLDIHVATLHRWRLKGKINAWKVGARWKVSKAEILNYPKLFAPPAKIDLPRSSTERQRKAYEDWAKRVLERARI